MARLVPNITLRSKQVALDMVPRVTLAQKLDSLSTLGNITGEMVLYERIVGVVPVYTYWLLVWNFLKRSQMHQLNA